MSSLEEDGNDPRGTQCARGGAGGSGLGRRAAGRAAAGLAGGVRAAEVLSGEGFGRQQLVQAGRGAAHEAEVIAYQEPTLIGWRERAKGAGARAEARTEIYVQLTPDEEEGGTIVRLIVVRWPAGPVKAALLRLGLRRVGADLEESLARLTDLAAVG